MANANQAALDWLENNYAQRVQDLKDLVSIKSISTDGQHSKEIDAVADLACEQMRQAGLENVDVLRTGTSNPYSYGEWLGAPGKPTLFLYAHHDVQPINFRSQWESDPWELTSRDGRLFGRGSADDKAAITAQLAAIAAYLNTNGSLPVNVKILVESEEEIGSTNLLPFFEEHRKRIESDVIVVCDTENIETGLPSLTYALRGVVTISVEVRSASLPVHSGMAGGALADAALALNVLLARLYWGDGPLPIPGFYDSVRPMSEGQKHALTVLPGDEATWRKDYGVLPNVQFALEQDVHLYEATWRKPAITLIAQEASSIQGASNQVLPRAQALISCRIVPDQDPDAVFEQIKAVLTENPPWGVEIDVKKHGSSVNWWMTDPQGPAFEDALNALHDGYQREPVAIGCGGTIGFVGPLADLLDGAPALLFGIEDPKTNAHAPNESLPESDWKNLMKSLIHLFGNLGERTPDSVK